MSTTQDLAKLAATDAAVLSWIDRDGYPLNVAVAPEVEPERGIVRFAEPAGLDVPACARVAITASPIRPGSQRGFDGRSHVTAWGVATSTSRGSLSVHVDRTWSWDELDLPLPAAYERGVPKALRYFEALSAERGKRVRPRLSAACRSSPPPWRQSCLASP